MHEVVYEFQAIVAGGLVAAVLLTLCHLLLWEARPNLALVPRYTIGVACLNLGVTVTGWILGFWLLPIVVWSIAGMGGAAVASLHIWREAVTRRRGANLIHQAIATLSEGGSNARRETRGSDDRGA